MNAMNINPLITLIHHLSQCFPTNFFFRLNSTNEQLDALNFLPCVRVLTNNKWRKNKVRYLLVQFLKQGELILTP